MGTYFERYKAGEHQAVWQDLVKLKGKVFEVPLYPDAWAVAQLTMERLQKNLHTLHQRLLDLGYQFKEQAVFESPNSTAVQKHEDKFGVLPLSLRAFYLTIGGVNFIGRYPGLTTLQPKDNTTDPLFVLSDPLCIFSIEESSAGYRSFFMFFKRVSLMISDDIYGKAEMGAIQEPYVELGRKTADPEVQVTLYSGRFVDYMRLNLSWGGFPAFSWATTPERRQQFESWFEYSLPPIPQDTINYLKKDLIPF